MRALTTLCVAVLLLVTGLACGLGEAQGATPSSGTLSANSDGSGNTVTWTGSVHPGTETGSQDEGIGCFGSDDKPADTTTTGCDVFTVTINVPGDFYKNFIGGPTLQIANFG